MWKALVAALAAFGCMAVLGSEAVRAEENPISGVSASADLAGGNATVGAPLTFRVRGSMVPPDEDGEAWLVFSINFGDGQIATSQRIDGESGESMTFTATHAYTEPGTYTVRGTAYHGHDFFGFRFSRTDTFKLQVFCEGFDPGPKNCPRGNFTPFTGRWNLDVAGQRGTLDAVEVAGSITGVLTMRDDATDTDTVFDVKGGATAGKVVSPETGGTATAIIARLRLKARPPAMPAKAPKATLELHLLYVTGSALSYRVGFARLTNTTAFDGTGRFSISERTADKTATICTSVGAGKRSVSPGDLLAVAVALQNQGPASLPTARLVLEIEVQGGTIPPEFVSTNRMTPLGSTTTTQQFTIGNLGDGRSGVGRAGLAFAVAVDEAATVVKVIVRVRAVNPHDDQPYATVIVPPDRVICVGVKR